MPDERVAFVNATAGQPRVWARKRRLLFHDHFSGLFIDAIILGVLKQVQGVDLHVNEFGIGKTLHFFTTSLAIIAGNPVLHLPGGNDILHTVSCWFNLGYEDFPASDRSATSDTLSPLKPFTGKPLFWRKESPGGSRTNLYTLREQSFGS
jgi:hypothetical protein